MATTKFNNIKGVIFDLDGTLYHKKWFMKPVMTLFSFPDPIQLPTYMRMRKKYMDKDMESGENLLRHIAKDMGNEEKMYNWITKKFYSSFVNSLALMRNSRPGINKLFSELKEKDIKIAILSDYSKIKERLDILKISSESIDLMISSEAEGFLKPGTGPFLKAAESFNLSPENILVIGDRDDTDGVAAKNSGMPFLKITDKKNSDGSVWSEVKEILGNL